MAKITVKDFKPLEIEGFKKESRVNVFKFPAPKRIETIKQQ